VGAPGGEAVSLDLAAIKERMADGYVAQVESVLEEHPEASEIDAALVGMAFMCSDIADLVAEVERLRERP
jgi:hypothetical protein